MESEDGITVQRDSGVPAEELGAVGLGRGGWPWTPRAVWDPEAEMLIGSEWRRQIWAATST